MRKSLLPGLRAAAIAVWVFLAMLTAFPPECRGADDSGLFIDGFAAFGAKDDREAVRTLSRLLETYPDTPLRDLALFFLARAHLRTGNQQDAARTMNRLLREYPGTPLAGKAEKALMDLASRHRRGERLPGGEGVQVAAAKPAGTLAAMDAPPKAGVESSSDVRSRKDLLAEEEAARKQTEKERIEREKADQERFARQAAERERLAREKAERERFAAAKAEEERQARERAEKERLVKEQAEREREARERAEQERLAREAAERERLAREKAERERLAAAKAEEERQVRERAEKERLAKEQAERERVARERAEQERLAKEEAERERLAREKAERERLAAAKAEEERQARERAEKERLAKEEAERARATAARKANEDAARLAAFDFALQLEGESHPVASAVPIPFAITNRGNAPDSYLLHAGFPPEFRPVFSSWNTPGTAITKTPPLAPGESFTGILTVVVPNNGIDGQRYVHPVKAASQRIPSVVHARETVLVASAPLLRAVLKQDKERVSPGERIEYAVTLLNVGTSPARDVTLRLICPDEYEAVGLDGKLFRSEGRSALVHEKLAIEPGETRDFRVMFRVREEAAAGKELRCRVKLLSGSLGTWDSFLSKAAHVAKP